MWEKKGLIFSPDGKYDWAQSQFGMITPQPFLLNGSTIRIYGGFRDKAGASRISYIDVDATNPSKILSVHSEIALNVGRPGMFDDNGVILGDVIRVDDHIRMYYVGFQIPSKAKFMAFSGLAMSHDGGNSFVRVQETPILDRTSPHPFIRAVHSVIHEQGVFKTWYSADDGWEIIEGKPYPRYHIRYVESADGIAFPSEGVLCVKPSGREYRIGRPRVTHRSDGIYEMRYSWDTLDKKYAAGMAFSRDGIQWERQDDKIGLSPGPEAWDNQTVCYPVVLAAAGQQYCFYSGNGMGQTGVGYAVWRG